MYFFELCPCLILSLEHKFFNMAELHKLEGVANYGVWKVKIRNVFKCEKL